MKISIVVPAFNEEALLPDSLRAIRAALAAFAAKGWEGEIVVCDNNSTDRTAEVARAAGAKVVFEPVNQISRARNAGARVAEGDWLVFVDADSYPSRELFADVAATIESGRVVGGGSTVRFDGNDRAAAFFVGAWNRVSRMTGWAAGSFLFCRAEAFRQAGGFSEELFASEEIDLSRRLKRLGRMAILHRHPLLTSDRKTRLYSWGEMTRFGLKTLLGRGKTLKSRDDCYAWYDGRR